MALDDRGLTLGDGLFETILAEAGELVAFEAHAARLIAGCAAMGLPAPDPAVLRAEALAALLAARLNQARAAVRLSWTAGSGGRGLDRPNLIAPRLAVTAAAAPRPEDPARLITAGVRRNEGSPASRLKSLSYIDNVLARAQARDGGADEAVMLNNRGEVACAAAANVFWRTGDVLYTPALDCGVLAGVARAEVLIQAAKSGIRVEEARAPLQAIAGAEAVFLTNSLIGVRPVLSLDGRALDQQVAQTTVLLVRGRR